MASVGFIGFGAAGMLWWGLAVLVPIAIHLLNRYRHKEIDWAAMELLRRALVVRARQVRIEDILILILRCLAVALLALAMARPTLRTSGGGLLGSQPDVGVVIALDGSYSMGHRPGVSTRFDLARARVRDILKTLRPGNPVTLVLLGKKVHYLTSLRQNTGYDEGLFDKVLAATTPLAERLDLETCLDELKPLVRGIGPSNRECYLVTDAQATSWQELSEKSRLALRELSTGSRVFFLSVASENAENLAVTNFALAAGALRKETMARYLVEVTNFGRQTQERVAVSLVLDDKPVDQRVVDRIAPGHPATVALFTRFTHAGNNRLSVRLGSDALKADNERHAVAYVRDLVQVLCVDGEPSKEAYKGETGYLATALVPKRGAPAGSTLLVKTVPYYELGAQRLADYQVVILANVPGVERAQLAALSSFVQQGGGLIVFLGGKSLSGWKPGQEGGALLPARLLALANPKGEPEGLPMGIEMPGHPVASALAALPEGLLNAARFTQYVKVAPVQGSRVILKIAGTDDPLLVEKSEDRGRVLLFTSTANRDWTDLVINPAYPILLHQAVAYLTRQEHERSFTVGELLNLTLPRTSTQSNVFIRDPSGQDRSIVVEESEGQRRLKDVRPEWPGFYEARYAPGLPPLVAAVNVESAESDVRSLVGSQLFAVFRGLPVRVLGAGDELAAAIQASRMGRPLWRYVLMLALLVLAVEAFLAHRFTRRVAGLAAREAVREEILGPRPVAGTGR